MAHVGRQARRELETPDLAVRLFRARQQRGFVGREVAKDVA